MAAWTDLTIDFKFFKANNKKVREQKI